MENVVFTPASVLSVLTKIDELKDVNIGMTETLDGKLQLQVGESVYELEPQSPTEISVETSVVEKVEDANQDAYEDLAESGEVELQEPVTSGILKEIAKTLLVGGMVRLTGKMMK